MNGPEQQIYNPHSSNNPPSSGGKGVIIYAIIVIILGFLGFAWFSDWFNRNDDSVRFDESPALQATETEMSELPAEIPPDDAVQIYEYPGTPLSKGATGDIVLFIQESLNEIGLSIPGIPILDEDGKFGSLTETTIKKFQRIMGLSDDGIVGYDTWNMIMNVRMNPSVIDW